MKKFFFVVTGFVTSNWDTPVDGDIIWEDENGNEVFLPRKVAAVGGILFLWIRGLPFSISAGVGFIALFGIAVLNGIVLIEHFKELKHSGMKNIDKLIDFLTFAR
jgi:hypothetical protein